MILENCSIFFTFNITESLKQAQSCIDFTDPVLTNHFSQDEPSLKINCRKYFNKNDETTCLMRCQLSFYLFHQNTIHFFLHGLLSCNEDRDIFNFIPVSNYQSVYIGFMDAPNASSIGGMFI